MGKERDQAREEALDRLNDYLAELGYKKGVCPICGGGTKTACFKVRSDGRHWKCFSCSAGGDIFDLYGKLSGGGGSIREVMEAVYRKYGIGYGSTSTGGKHTHTDTHTHTHTDMKTNTKKAEAAEMSEASKEEALKRFKAYLLQAQDRLSDPAAVAYLEKRGLSYEIGKRYGLGYDPEWKHEKAPKSVPTPRLIIPTGVARYTARDIRGEEDIPEAERKNGYYHAKMKAVAYENPPAELFNEAALAAAGIYGEERPLYVVEGEIDAISIEVAGGMALGLGSVSNISRLILKIDELDKKHNADLRKIYGDRIDEAWELWSPKVIIALDADEAGEKAARSLSDALGKLGIDFIREDPKTLYRGLKDANEALVVDANGLRSRLVTSLEAYKKHKQELLSQTAEAYRAEKSAVAACGGFLARVEGHKASASAAIPTGFSRLDMRLSGDRNYGDNGGLMEGLYVLGAPSSCGKTTYALQMADSIAESGRDVLIVSLEMSKEELVSKSLSRLTFLQACEEVKADRRLAKEGVEAVAGLVAKTNYGISKGNRYPYYNETEWALIDGAVKYYREKIGPRVFILQGAIGGTSAQEVVSAIAEHKTRTGAAPVVILDYLQMLKPENERITDKQAVDRNILKMKVASREYHTPIICISSYNRENYFSESSLSSFKESGSIEYSADVVLALSYSDIKAVDSGEKGKTEAKAKLKAIGEADKRNITLDILKNRSGGKGSVYYRFYALFNCFKELDEIERLRG